MAKSNRLMARVVKLLPRTCGPCKELRGANKMQRSFPFGSAQGQDDRGTNKIDG
jgi:hypothetical protein